MPTLPSLPPNVREIIDRALGRIRQTVPPGLRLVLGLILIVGGMFGFLPVLGFWMIPLGIAVCWLDIKPMMRHFWKRDE